MRYAEHEIVTSPYDPDYGPSQTVDSYYGCPICAAIVHYLQIDQHMAWHAKHGETHG